MTSTTSHRAVLCGQKSKIPNSTSEYFFLEFVIFKILLTHNDGSFSNYSLKTTSKGRKWAGNGSRITGPLEIGKQTSTSNEDFSLKTQNALGG